MTVATTARKQQFALDGTTSTLTFTFRALVSAPTDIKVTNTASGVDTDLTYTTDYTVAVNANGVGGVVTLVDAANTGAGTATVYRETTNTQASDYDDYNQFPANTVETDLDIRTLISQELSEDKDRALTLAITTAAGVSASLPAPEANKVIGWDGAGTALTNREFTASTDFEKASVAEAQAGSDNTKYMTPSISSIAILAAKASPVPADSLAVNDSADSNKQKKSTLTQITTGLDITSLTGKSTPIGADEVILSDSEASNAIKKATLTNIVALAALNVKVGNFTRDLTLTASTQAITGVGFEPSAVIFFAGIATQDEMSIGMSMVSAEGSVNDRNGVGAGTWDVSTARVMIASESSGVNSLVDMTSLDADGFTLTWAKNGSPAGTYTINYLAIG